MEESKPSPMSAAFTVTSICREDLIHPIIGFTISEARDVSDSEMKEIASKLGNYSGNQILKSSIKMVAEDILKNRRSSINSAKR